MAKWLKMLTSDHKPNTTDVGLHTCAKASYP